MSQKAYCSGSSFPELKKGSLRLYSSRLCPYAERARLVLAHKNIPHEVINIDLKNKPEWFLKIAPMGKVPVLQKDDKILYESTAVSEYLDDVYPGDKLQVQDPLQKAQDRILLECFGMLTGGLYAMRSATTPEEIEAKVAQITKGFQFYEDELAKRPGPFFGGAKASMIDFFLFPHLERVPAITKLNPKIEISKSDYPKLAAWWGSMTQLPAVQKEMFDADWHFQVIKLSMEGKPVSDYGLEQ